MLTNFKSIKASLEKGEITVEKLVQNYLDQINHTKDLNVYINIYAEEALTKAREIDEKTHSGQSVGKLAGMVLSIKDVLCYKDHPVTAGSKILKGFNSLFTATGIQRLLDEDAIIIGNVNCDEFAMGSSNENSCYGPTKNGYDPERIPGGSSGASAVSVQMDTCLVALGTDTGGSVRQPAAYCGVIGMKPSYGRISRYGLIAYASSFDQMGIISKDLFALSLVLSIAAGDDPKDGTSSTLPVQDYHNFDMSSESRKIAFFQECVSHPGLDAENKRLFLEKIEKLKSLGHTVESISFPLIDFLVPTYYILTTAEASSNLSRFDGVRYGHRTKNPSDINDLYKRTRDEGFGLEVKRRIVLGTFVLSSGYFDAYYTKAQKSRRLIKEEMEKIFSESDFIVMPSTTGQPWKIGEMDKDPVAIYLADIFTVLANLCGIPAINVPYYVDKLEDNHYGFQVLAPYMEEKSLLSFINNYLFMA